MKIVKGCLLSISAGILGILIVGGAVLLATDGTRSASIAGLLAGALAPILTVLGIWVFNRRYWADAIQELRNRLS